MPDCRHCGEILSSDMSRFGARCPRCREPLYERPDAQRRRRDEQESRGGVCAVHPGNVAVGPCKRCGTFMCGICRSRLGDRILCLACVERVLGETEKLPEEIKSHRWQALTSVLLGSCGWMLTLPMAFVLAIKAANGATGAVPWVVIMLTVLAVISFIPSLFGLGMAAAAVRIRGDRMVLATCGLVLTGAQLGTATGMVLLVMWKP